MNTVPVRLRVQVHREVSRVQVQAAGKVGNHPAARIRSFGHCTFTIRVRVQYKDSKEEEGRGKDAPCDSTGATTSTVIMGSR
jgi:hypothetical protein